MTKDAKPPETFIHMPLIGGCGVTVIGRGQWTKRTYEQFVAVVRAIADTFPDDDAADDTPKETTDGGV